MKTVTKTEVPQFTQTELANWLEDGNKLPCYGKTELFVGSNDHKVEDAETRETQRRGRVEAKKFCQFCPGQELCLQASIYHEPPRMGTKGGWRLLPGIWGGLDTAERAFLLDRKL